MSETSFPKPASDGIDVDLADLADPIASVIAVELSRRVVRRGLSWAEPMVTDLASQETVLRQAGGIDLVKRIFALRFYRRVDAEVFQLLRQCVPLAHADFVLSRVEVLLRAHFADIVGTAASHLLSHDRDTAIQMTAVAATMAGHEVHTEVMAIMAEMRLIESDAP